MCKNINKLPDVLLISASDKTFSNNFVSSIQTGSSLEEPSDPPEVNLTNILRAAFSLIIFCQKITKPNCNKRKAAKNTIIQKRAAYKMLVKLTPERRSVRRPDDS